jgi:hypothetical protein
LSPKWLEKKISRRAVPPIAATRNELTCTIVLPPESLQFLQALELSSRMWSDVLSAPNPAKHKAANGSPKIFHLLLHQISAKSRLDITAGEPEKLATQPSFVRIAAASLSSGRMQCHTHRRGWVQLPIQ